LGQIMATKLEVATVIAASLAAAATVGGFGYYMGRDTASSEVSQLTPEIEWLKSAQGIENALDYLSDISAYNDNLFEFARHEEQLSEKNTEIEKLTDTVDLLNSRAETLQSELEKSTKALKVSEERITDLSDSLAIKYDIRQSVSLLEGESHMILDGAAIIGLQSSYNNRAVITLQNETEFLDVGSVSEIKVEDARCIVALRRTSMYEGSDFDLICRSEKN